jgi:hypothetical protein
MAAEREWMHSNDSYGHIFAPGANGGSWPVAGIDAI